MARIVILGAGVMGTAFGVPLADRGHRVAYVGTPLDRDWIASMQETGRHPKLGVTIPETATAHQDEDLAAVLSGGADLLVLGVSSAGVDWAIDRLARTLPPGLPILLLTKGLAATGDSLRILPDVVTEGLVAAGHRDVRIAAVGGPCIAGELAVRRETGVVIAAPDRRMTDWLVELTAAPYYHARPSTDMIGVEACAALKNFYALGIGYPAGVQQADRPAANDAVRHNPAAGLFDQAILEMVYLVDHLGGQTETVYGLAGVGDLYVTCQAGRNSRMGRWLGTGLTYSETMATHMKGETVEGADLARTIGPTVDRLLAHEHMKRDRLPLAMAIIDAICHDRPVEMPWSALWREAEPAVVSAAG